MSLSNEIVLRPRFQIALEKNRDEAIGAFEKIKKETKDFVITIVEDHVFLKIPKAQQHFWSPQLDMEFITDEQSNCTLHGLFGPKPAVWTMFMFMHFVVASIFIGGAIWTYTKVSLDEPFAFPVFLMAFMVIAWFVLYFAGRMGKTAGRKEMLAMHGFMKETLQL